MVVSVFMFRSGQTVLLHIGGDEANNDCWRIWNGTTLACGSRLPFGHVKARSLIRFAQKLVQEAKSKGVYHDGDWYIGKWIVRIEEKPDDETLTFVPKKTTARKTIGVFPTILPFAA